VLTSKCFWFILLEHPLTLIHCIRGRFRVTSPVDGNETLDDFEWRMYNVYEMNDEDLSIPSIFKRPRPDHGSTDLEEAQVYLRRNKRIIRDISTRTHVSPYALRLMWPAKLVSDIVDEIESNAVYEGVKNTLPCTDERFDGRFSFWLSSNLPLSIMEKLDVLEAYSAVERMQLLLQMIRRRTAFIRCRQCKSNIAQVNTMFTVGSAEGTSGAYGEFAHSW